MEELMIKIDNVSKRYRLGEIGGTTLHQELQRARARRRHEEDPISEVGSENYTRGESFMALDGISFRVNKGERVGIIGHNGAGKSTLLKLITRVTAPTGGAIGLNGRVASMLEVGTGFHGELTGRENIYMNGAILGMSKKEIDAKIEDIIDFSECRQFIDTPVKRYSSGMYVKLAFSVAAHLDSEIMIMDEVLAVGDMAFQKKCLNKMNEVSKAQGRTILYVSHNMNTIRQLCNRCIVLEHGRLIFDEGVEEAISLYMGNNKADESLFVDLTALQHDIGQTENIHMKYFEIVDKESIDYLNTEKLKFKLTFDIDSAAEAVSLRLQLNNEADLPIGMCQSEAMFLPKGTDQILSAEFDLSLLREGKYRVSLGFFYIETTCVPQGIDYIENICSFNIIPNPYSKTTYEWRNKIFGNIELPKIEVTQGE